MMNETLKFRKTARQEHYERLLGKRNPPRKSDHIHECRPCCNTAEDVQSGAWRFWVVLKLDDGGTFQFPCDAPDLSTYEAFKSHAQCLYPSLTFRDERFEQPHDPQAWQAEIAACVPMRAKDLDAMRAKSMQLIQAAR